MTEEELRAEQERLFQEANNYVDAESAPDQIGDEPQYYQF